MPAPRLLDAWRSAPVPTGARHLAVFAERKLRLEGTPAELREWLLGRVPGELLAAAGEGGTADH